MSLTAPLCDVRCARRGGAGRLVGFGRRREGSYSHAGARAHSCRAVIEAFAARVACPVPGLFENRQLILPPKPAVSDCGWLVPAWLSRRKKLRVHGDSSLEKEKFSSSKRTTAINLENNVQDDVSAGLWFIYCKKWHAVGIKVPYLSPSVLSGLALN